MKKIHFLISIMMISLFIMSACMPTNKDESTLPIQITKDDSNTMDNNVIDQTYEKKDGIEVIYLAGGCFWGMEKFMQSIPGVLDVVSGYANGSKDIIPTYEEVLTQTTDYRETVRVTYDPELISLDAILFAYFEVIDPTLKNQQGNDIGTQYQTGVYYADEMAKATVERIVEIEKARHSKFFVEIKAIERFFDAEEYHQNYLDKNPTGYCHISKNEMSMVGEMMVDPGKYQRPSDSQIKSMLTDLQFNVTQESGTEPAFSGDYWDYHDRGIYVDVVTGEPLFSSIDKYDSGTGWPSFTKPIDENTIRYISDYSLGMARIEVRSRAGNSHLGHVFYNDPGSSSGTRFCINSAALKFIPYSEMESQGYGYLLNIFN